MDVAPYLYFEGVCAEAIAFYKAALGAEVTMVMRYADAPPSDGQMELPPGSGEKIMHASFKVGTTEINASDGMCTGQSGFGGFSLALRARDAAEVERYFKALAVGGEVRQPLTETFFSPCFGMVADKFGVGWIVIAQS